MATVAASAAVLRADDAAKPLAEAIDSIINDARYKTAHWGILIVDRESGQILYEHQAEKLFAPASTTKLFSSAAALDALGADHRFKTPVYAIGKLEEGVLTGNLVLVASGDLTMGGRTDSSGKIAYTESDHIYAQFNSTAELTTTDPLAGLDELARQVAEEVRHVKGDVLIDERLFEHAESTGSGPEKVTPILVNDNLVDFAIEPTEPGKPARIRSQPQSLAIGVDAQVETVAAGETTAIDLRRAKGNRFIVRGTIAAGRKPMVRTEEVEDPAAFARSLFIEALLRVGVRVDASPLALASASLPEDATYEGQRRVALLESPPFAENVKLILKVSHNLHASTLPLLVAARHGERTLEAGMRRQHDFFHRAGIDLAGVSFGGAAGGARADYVSPRAAVQLLRHMASHKDFAAFNEGLPVLGIDGTLAKAVGADSPAKGKVRAKTGTLLWQNLGNGQYLLTSKALAGYAKSSSGRELAFAMFVNNLPIPESESGARAAGETLGKLAEAMVVRAAAK